MVQHKLEIVKLVLSHGADAQAKLTAAVFSRCAETTKLLIAPGAEPNAPAGRKGPSTKQRVAGVLIDAGADGDAYTWLRIETSSKNGVDADVARTVDLLLATGADVNWRKRGGVTPLLWACRLD
jgi:ankyrin repeat protein